MTQDLACNQNQSIRRFTLISPFGLESFRSFFLFNLMRCFRLGKCIKSQTRKTFLSLAKSQTNSLQKPRFNISEAIHNTESSNFLFSHKRWTYFYVQVKHCAGDHIPTLQWERIQSKHTHSNCQHLQVSAIE